MGISGKTTEVSRAIQVLEGFLKGIAADDIIENEEIIQLNKWLDNHRNLKDICPFSDLYEIIGKITDSKLIEDDIKNEILEFCNDFETKNGPIDKLTVEMRNLHGFIHGIIADKIITKEELEALQIWMNIHTANEDKWPFNEIKVMIEKVLEDGIVDDQEQKELLKFFSNFLEKKVCDNFIDETISDGGWMKSDAPVLNTIQGIIDKDCRIKVKGNLFCCTGQMSFGKRADVHNLIKNKKGIPVSSVTKSLNYLVIGALSNPVWAYSTYGRKIEKAMNFNKNGSRISIIHEDDLLKKINC